MSMLDPLDRQARLKERIDALGPWFHNIELDGVWTAPDHFLGDYPGFKYRRFAHLPQDWKMNAERDAAASYYAYSDPGHERASYRM